MRTTINIDDELLVEVKQISATKRVPIGDVVDQALRDYLAQRDLPPVDFSWADVAVDIPDDRGLRPGVDWRSNSVMLELIDDL